MEKPIIRAAIACLSCLFQFNVPKTTFCQSFSRSRLVRTNFSSRLVCGKAPLVRPERGIEMLPWQLFSGGTALETSGDKPFPARQVFYLLKKLQAKLMQEAADDRRSSTKWIVSVSQIAKVNAVKCRSGDRLLAERLRTLL